MLLRNEERWNEYVEANKDEPYGWACVTYARQWAELMEARLAAGESLEAVAVQTSHEADTDGITGFMYGAAVQMLAECWQHGETLRRWHNLRTQLRHEGETANKSGGVLNPALLILSGLKEE